MKKRKLGNLELIKYPDDQDETVIVSSDNLEEAIEVINMHNFRNIHIDRSYNKKDIEFLKYCPSIEKMDISNTVINNFDGIKYLKNLKLLSLNINPKVKIDIGELVELKELTGWIPSETKGFNQLRNLTRLHLFSYKPQSKSLLELSKIANLKELSLSQANIETLRGIEVMKNLKEVSLYGMRNLTDITSLQFLTAPVEIFSVEKCKNIQDFDVIKNLKDLREIRLLDCGSVPSISFIKDLEKLDSFVFDGTTIMDGDLSYCERLEYVYFNQKKHYSHKLKDLNSEL